MDGWMMDGWMDGCKTKLYDGWMDGKDTILSINLLLQEPSTAPL